MSDLSILNDPLISDMNTNDLIRKNCINKIFISENVLNVYGALVRREDLNYKQKNTFLKPSPNLIEIAKIVRPVKNAAKIRINQSDQSISDDLKKLFEIDINKDAKRPYGFSRTLELFFDKFFEYAHIREPLGDTEINSLIKEWNTIWLFNDSS